MNKELQKTEETAIAETGKSALDILDEHAETLPLEIGFMRIKPSRGAKAFSMGELGTKDSPLECIILSVNNRRGLWPPDGTVNKDYLAAMLGVVPDDVNYDAKKVDEWRGNRPLCCADASTEGRGTLPKILDAEAPEVVARLLSLPQKVDYICAKCKWNEFGSDFKGTSGKACKESRLLLLYFPGEDDMIATLSIPPTSIGSLRRYKTSIPRQQLHKWFTSISTRPSEGSYEYNVIEFEPVKQRGKVAVVTPHDVAALNQTVVYDGMKVPKIAAYLSEFMRIPIENETDYIVEEPSETPFDETPDDEF